MENKLGTCDKSSVPHTKAQGSGLAECTGWKPLPAPQQGQTEPQTVNINNRYCGLGGSFHGDRPCAAKPQTEPQEGQSEPLDDPLGIRAAMLIAGGHAKLTQDLIATKPQNEPKRPETIKDAGLGKKYWAHEADAYMDYLEGRVRELEAQIGGYTHYPAQIHNHPK